MTQSNVNDRSRNISLTAVRLSRLVVVLGLATAFLSAGTPSGLSGQEDGKLEVTGTLANGFFYGGVGSSFSTDQGIENTVGLDDGLGVGLRVGWRFSDRVTGELAVTSFPTEIVVRGGQFTVGFDADVTMTEGTFLYHLGDPQAPIRPFLAAGGGAVSYAGSFRTEWDGMWNVGGGVRLELGDLVDLRFDLRDYMSSFDALENVENEDARFQNHVVLSTGLVFSLF